MVFDGASKVSCMNLLSERVGHIIRETGLSPSAIAKVIGITASAVLQWESGHTKTIKPEHLFKLADMTGFSARWIGTGDGPERDPAATNHRVKDLIDNYARLDERGRRHVLEVAEREAGYASDDTA